MEINETLTFNRSFLPNVVAFILLCTGGKTANNRCSVSLFILSVTHRRRVHSLDGVKDVPLSHFHCILLLHVHVEGLMLVICLLVVDPPVGEIVEEGLSNCLHVEPA